MLKQAKDITLYLSGPEEVQHKRARSWDEFVEHNWPGKVMRPGRIGDIGAGTDKPLNELCQGLLLQNMGRIEQADAVLLMWRGNNAHSLVEAYHAKQLGRPVYLLNESGSGALSVYLMACVTGVAARLTGQTLEDIRLQLEGMDLNGVAAH